MNAQYLTEGRFGHPTTISGWPTHDIEGLFDALSRWALDPNMAGDDENTWPPQAHTAPYSCFAWCACITKRQERNTLYRGTRPMHDDHPTALSYSGNFQGYSYGFNVVTDDPALIARLDAAIAANMATPEYCEAVRLERERKAFRSSRAAKAF